MPDGTSYVDQFGGPSVLMFVGVEVQLPSGGWVRWLDGSGQVSFSGKTFLGLDPEFGALATLEAISDGFGDTAPSVQIGVNPATADGGAILAGQDMQGCSVLLWLGALNSATGDPVDTPLLIFAGEVDQGILKVGLGTRLITLACVSIWERLFDDAEGVRLSNSFHQSAWPGELGFQFVTAIQRQLPWGADTPRPAVQADALYTRPATVSGRPA